MSEGKIHFSNEPFMARVADKGTEPVKCVPVVYDSLANCGVGVVFEDGSGQIWGMITPRNLIAAWRGTEVLRHFDAIGHGTLCSAYYTGVRDPHESDMKSYVKPTIAKIGHKTYDTIMRMPIPEEIVKAILDNQQEKFAPALYPITEEVRAGTIKWRQEFAEYGIQHPDEVDARDRLQKETIKKFEELLISYAKSQNTPRDCFGMGYVESALLTLVDKGADKAHEQQVVVALAGVVGDLASSNFTMNLMPFCHPRNKREYDNLMNLTKREALSKSAKWLALDHEVPTPTSFLSKFAFWRKPPPNSSSFTEDSARDLLICLFDEYFPQTTESATT